MLSKGFNNITQNLETSSSAIASGVLCQDVINYVNKDGEKITLEEKNQKKKYRKAFIRKENGFLVGMIIANTNITNNDF